MGFQLNLNDNIDLAGDELYKSNNYDILYYQGIDPHEYTTLIIVLK